MPNSRRAMVFAAGEGRRMLPLTATTPKPLLPLGNSHLIGENLKRLSEAGISEVIINTAYLGEQIQAALGDGEDWGVRICYSPEPFPLETGGALWQALPLLGEEPFVLINADVFCDYPLINLCSHSLASGALGHLILVPNPEQHPEGDFALGANGVLAATGSERFTFSGISLLRPDLIRSFPAARQVFPLREALSWAMEQGRITGEVHEGLWLDVGTPARLAAAQVLWAEL